MSYNGMQNDIGDTMKQLEAVEAGRRVNGVVLCRVDGKGFHNYTTKMKMQRPFDGRLELLRCHVVASIMKQTGARMGYAQSDEMSFVWHVDIYCAGRVAKMVSHMASMATAYWNRKAVGLNFGEDHDALFDARVWSVPDLATAETYFRWRQWDAQRNSVSQMARSLASHKEMFELTEDQLLELIRSRGGEWNDCMSWAKYGTYTVREVESTVITDSTGLPPKHAAHKALAQGLGFPVVRNVIRALAEVPAELIPYMQVESGNEAR